ncbi:hypothetical protein STEG23_002693, partial [Scotinomys teguina]
MVQSVNSINQHAHGYGKEHQQIPTSTAKQHIHNRQMLFDFESVDLRLAFVNKQIIENEN